MMSSMFLCFRIKLTAFAGPTPVKYEYIQASTDPYSVQHTLNLVVQYMRTIMRACKMLSHVFYTGGGGTGIPPPKL